MLTCGHNHQQWFPAHRDKPSAAASNALLPSSEKATARVDSLWTGWLRRRSVFPVANDHLPFAATIMGGVLRVN